MKITVVTVCYNSAATVVDTLRSVAAQTHGDLEHIIIDGASTDATVSLVREHGGHVASLVSEPDRGIYDAMNKGLRLASGDAVGFLNADDVFADHDVITRLAAAFDSASRPNIVYGDLVYVAGHDTGAVVRQWRSGGFSHSRLKYGWMPPHPTFYVRRSLLDAAGGFDTSMKIAADYEFMVRYLTRTEVSVAYVPNVLVRMRLGGISNNSIASMLEKSREDLNVIRRHGIGNWLTLAAKNLRKIPQFVKPAFSAPATHLKPPQ